MSSFAVDISAEFLSQYDELPKPIQKKFKKQLKYLKESPKHRSLKIHRIQGTDFWEFYIDEGYRCIFKRSGAIFQLYFVGTHQLIDQFQS